MRSSDYGVQIRDMTVHDLQQVYAIELAAHQTPWSLKIFMSCLQVGYHCLVIECMSESIHTILGYLICRFESGSCHILNFCIDPKHQRNGYGQQLLNHAIHSIDQTQFDKVILEVRPSNAAALNLYYRFGFSQVRVKRNYYRDESGFEDAVVLEKKLP